MRRVTIILILAVLVFILGGAWNAGSDFIQLQMAIHSGEWSGWYDVLAPERNKALFALGFFVVISTPLILWLVLLIRKEMKGGK